MSHLFIVKSRANLDAMWTLNSLHELLLVYVLEEEFKLRFV